MSPIQSSEFNDKDLILLLQKGDSAAFDKIYYRFSKSIYQKISYMVKSTEVAEELLQDVFFKVWQKREEIDPEKSFKSWLLTITQNLVYDYFRRLANDVRMQQHLIDTFAGFYNQTEEYIFNKESNDLLNKALEKLSPQRREIFKLCKIEGKSYKEAAEILSISTSTVSNQLVHATKSIKNYFFFHSGELLLLFIIANSNK